MLKHFILKLFRLIIITLLKLEHSGKKNKIAVIFQNNDDRDVFIENRIVNEEQTYTIKGSGVDLNNFVYTVEPNDGTIRILFTARMLRDKGVLELVEAAAILKKSYYDTVQFLLCGDVDDNPHSLTRQELYAISDGQYIVWLGYRKDVRELLEYSHIFSFPSYREGLPKSLIEACASGRPIITTNSVGCRDCVIDGYNGFLVPVKNSVTLAQKLEVLINDKNLRLEMGKNSRKLAERDFSVENVVEKHIEIYNSLIKDRGELPQHRCPKRDF